jgi:SAM-dependent methyltransferase
MAESGGNFTERFSNRVEQYVRYRPMYPARVLEILRDEIGLRPEWIIADVGSGTGISAELLLQHGNAVFGVEPNAAMRAAAERQLAEYPTFHSFSGTAEATTLGNRSIDCVVAAQAFHWFDPQRTRAEFQRILRPGGWVVLLWNARRLDATPFLREYEALLSKYGTDYARVRHERIDEAALTEFFGDRQYFKGSVDNFQALDWDGFRGRLLSSSYVPDAGQPRYEEMLVELEQLFEKHQRDGRVTIEYDTQVFAGRLS